MQGYYRSSECWKNIKRAITQLVLRLGIVNFNFELSSKDLGKIEAVLQLFTLKC